MQNLKHLLVTDVLTNTLLKEGVDYKVEEHENSSYRRVNSKTQIDLTGFPSPYELRYTKTGQYFSNKLNKSRKKNKAAKKARRLNRK